MDNNLPSSSVFSFLAQLPLLVTWVVGFAIAAAQKARHPRKMTLVMMALGIFIFNWCGHMVMSFVIPRLATYDSMSWMFFAQNMVSMLVSTVAWIIILIAILGGREEVSRLN